MESEATKKKKKINWKVIAIIFICIIVVLILTKYILKAFRIPLSGLKPSYTSAKGAAFTKSQEGLQNNAYQDGTDANGNPVWAIGYGHHGNMLDGTPITPLSYVSNSDADALFKQDLALVDAKLNSLITTNKIDQNAWDALSDFEYNTEALATSQLLTYVNNNDFANAAAFLKLHYITSGNSTNPLPGLVARRAAEATEIIS